MKLSNSREATLSRALTLRLVLGLTLGLGAAVLAASGPAAAFPQPKYPASSAPPPTASGAAAAGPAAPAAKSAATSAKSWSIYVVQKGDTLSGVSRRFGEPTRNLADLNELDPKTPLKAGLKIKLPPGVADSGKDPYASGPSPSSMGGGEARAQVKPTVKPPAQVATAPQAPVRAPTNQTPPAHPTTQRPALPTDAPGDAPMDLPGATPSREAGAAPSDGALAGRSRFIWPLKGDVISGFGPLSQGQKNDGINIAADRGTEVRAAADGVVVYAGSEVKGYGNTILIRHADGWNTIYSHLDRIAVGNRGYKVKQGQVIGTVGATGDVDRSQLHFETRYSASAKDKYNPVDPVSVLPR